MNPEHVIALIAAVLQVRNSVIISAEPSPAKRDIIMESLGDPIEEARELLRDVVNDVPQFPDAPNTKGGAKNG